MERAALHALLRAPSVRLLTLTGPGGVGKTRLAVEVAADLAEEFGDGVWFVPLATVSEPAVVLPAVATALGLRDRGEGSPDERLRTFLFGRRLLLLLDNLEHLLGAAPLVAGLLADCPLLKVVATSRSGLRVSGEHEVAVPPLAIPDGARSDPVAAVRDSPACQLFVARARAVRADFSLTRDSSLAVARLCARLDGLPLAIELAAVRMKLLSPEEILERLERPLELLTGGPSDLPARHRQLRQAIAWSYELLDDAERRLFRGLAAFVGGCSLEAVEEVLAPSGDGAHASPSVLDGLMSLVDKGLVRRVGGEDRSRLEMLETIREFALQILAASGEEAAVREAHARYYGEVAATAASRLGGSDQQAAMARLAQEHDNLRAALSWHLGRGDAEEALALCLSLWQLWLVQGHASEGGRRLRQALALVGERPTPERAFALGAAGILAHFRGEDDEAEGLCDACLALARRLGDPEVLAFALNGRGLLARSSPGGVAMAGELYREALSLSAAPPAREGGPTRENASAAASALQGLAWVALRQGDEDAGALFADSLTRFEELGDRLQATGSLYALAQIALREGDLDQGFAHCQRVIDIAADLGDAPLVAIGLQGLAQAAIAAGRGELGVRLLAAAERAREETGVPWPGLVRAGYEDALAAARALVREDAFAAAWVEGTALTVEEAQAVRLEDVSSLRRPAEGLTHRELEVLDLVAAGLSDAEVARRLVVSPRTVHSHLRSIYRKLGVGSRAGASAYLMHHRLAAIRAERRG